MSVTINRITEQFGSAAMSDMGTDAREKGHPLRMGARSEPWSARSCGAAAENPKILMSFRLTGLWFCANWVVASGKKFVYHSRLTSSDSCAFLPWLARVWNWAWWALEGGILSGQKLRSHEFRLTLSCLSAAIHCCRPSLRDPFSEIVFYLRTNPRVEKDGERCKQGTALAQSLFSASHRGQEKRRPCIDSSGIDGFTLARISVFTRLWYASSIHGSSTIGFQALRRKLSTALYAFRFQFLTFSIQWSISNFTDKDIPRMTCASLKFLQ